MAHLDDEQHYERLDMDNDYEGGEFIGGEFYHRGKRQRKQQTREDQIYGVFADDSGASPPARPVSIQFAGDAAGSERQAA
jgi:tuftelin-interacting protein 11